MNFCEIQVRLLDYLRKRIRNGDFTERGFARTVSLSQSHIHKVLSGARTLSLENADWILRCLHLNIEDFFEEKELAEQLSRLRFARQAFIEVPYIQEPIGPGYRWTSTAATQQTRPVPCQQLEIDEEVIAAPLAWDPDMVYSQQGANLAAIALGLPRSMCCSPTSLYVLGRVEDVVIRRVRFGAQAAYSVPDSEMNAPLHWKAIAWESILGRVLWIGSDAALRQN